MSESAGIPAGAAPAVPAGTAPEGAHTALTVDFVAADRPVWSGGADMVVAPAAGGEIGILPGHAPILTILKPGEIRVIDGRTTHRMAVSGGFLSVDLDNVEIVVDEAKDLTPAGDDGSAR